MELVEDGWVTERLDRFRRSSTDRHRERTLRGDASSQTLHPGGRSVRQRRPPSLSCPRRQTAPNGPLNDWTCSSHIAGAGAARYADTLHRSVLGERRVEEVDVVELNRDGADRREGALVGAAKESERRTGRFEVLHPWVRSGRVASLAVRAASASARRWSKPSSTAAWSSVSWDPVRSPMARKVSAADSSSPMRPTTCAPNRAGPPQVGGGPRQTK